jgi:transposase, IS5 family
MATDDFFCARLNGMVDPRHPLAVLARRLPWAQIEASLAPLFARKARMGKSREDADMFGPTLVVAAGGVDEGGHLFISVGTLVAGASALFKMGSLDAHATRVNCVGV